MIDGKSSNEIKEEIASPQILKCEMQTATFDPKANTDLNTLLDRSFEGFSFFNCENAQS